MVLHLNIQQQQKSSVERWEIGIVVELFEQDIRTNIL